MNSSCIWQCNYSVFYTSASIFSHCHIRGKKEGFVNVKTGHIEQRSFALFLRRYFMATGPDAQQDYPMKLRTEGPIVKVVQVDYLTKFQPKLL